MIIVPQVKKKTSRALNSAKYVSVMHCGVMKTDINLEV